MNEFRMLLAACWMLSVTCFTIPGRGGPLDVSAFDSIAIIKTVLRAASLLLVSLLVLRLNFRPRTVPVLRRLLPFFVFALWAAVSAAWSPLKAVSLGHAIELITLVGIAICAGILVDSDERQSRLCLHLFLAAVLASLTVLVLEFPAIWHGERPSGYMHANALGAISGSALILLLSSRFFWSWTWTGRLLIPGTAVCLMGLYAARSRTCLLAGAIMLPILFLIAKRRALVLAAIIAAGVVLAMAPYVGTVNEAPLAIEKYVMRGQTKTDLAEASGRQELWTRALVSFRESPLLGHGYFMLSRSGTMYVWLKNQYQTAHSLYLHVLTGTGLIGAVLFLCAMVSAIGRPVPSMGYVALLLLTGWFALVGLFELSILGPVDPSSVLFFAVLGASVKTAAYDEPPLQRSGAGLCPAAGLRPAPGGRGRPPQTWRSAPHFKVCPT